MSNVDNNFNVKQLCNVKKGINFTRKLVILKRTNSKETMRVKIVISELWLVF